MAFFASFKLYQTQPFTSAEIQLHEIDYIGCKSITTEIYGKMIIELKSSKNLRMKLFFIVKKSKFE